MKKPKIVMVSLLTGLGLAWSSRWGWAGEVTSIDQASALTGGITPGDAPAFPITLSRPGHYKLTGDLIIDLPGKNVIEITAHHVTVDLNHYTISGSQGAQGGATIGIVNILGSAYTTVRNGTVTNMSSDGLNLSFAAHVENIRALANGGSGIAAGPDSLIQGCTVLYNNPGIFCLTSCIVMENRVSGNSTAGISISDGGLVKDNIVNNNTYGIIDRYEDAYLGGSLLFSNLVHHNQGYGLLMNRNSRRRRNMLIGNNGGEPDLQTQGGNEIRRNLRAIEKEWA